MTSSGSSPATLTRESQARNSGSYGRTFRRNQRVRSWSNPLIWHPWTRKWVSRLPAIGPHRDDSNFS
jgi:hypothetical protein